MLNAKITTNYLATLLFQAYADHHHYLSDDERELISQYCTYLDWDDIGNLEMFLENFISDHDFVKIEELERDIYRDCEVVCTTQKLALIKLY